MPILERDTASIYYESYKPEGDVKGAIVFAHGAGGNAGIWFNQIAHFSAAYHVVAFDHRYFARSPASKPINVHDFRDDLLALLDRNNIEIAHLVGQSMGGFTVLRTTLDNPDRVATLTMSATSGGIYNPNPSPAFKNLTTSSGRGTEGIKATMSQATSQNPALMQLYESINNFNTEFSWEKLGTLLTPQDVVQHTQLNAVQTPTLFIAGAEDPLFPQEQLAACVPHFGAARIEVVQDSGHSPYFEQPQIFNQLLTDHISG
ncbi:MAG: alpha/beta hydrolase [Pseudomonadota bacterium]